MNKQSNDASGQTGEGHSEWGTTRRAVLAAGGAVALGALAGCATLDGAIDRGAEQLVGTTVSSPAALYPGRASATAADSSASTQDGDETQFVPTGPLEAKQVPATVQANGQEIELEGWSTSGQQTMLGGCCVGKSFAGKPPRTLGSDRATNGESVDDGALREYLENEPTVGERFTVCLPNAELPGDRGSLVEELTLDRVLAYFAPSREPDGVRAPFHDRYGDQGIEYDADGCIRTAGPVSLHEDIACQNILSAELDTYRTAERGIAADVTDGGAEVSGAPESGDIVGKRVFLTSDGTGEIILGEDRDMVMPGNGSSNTQTLVCPVAVTPVGCPTPLPGLFYVRRCIHDDQIVFAGGWVLDEGTLFERSVTVLFAEGPTEVASVTPADIESDEYEDRLVEQFSRDRSQYGSAAIRTEFDDDDGVPELLTAAIGGKKGYDVYMGKARTSSAEDGGSSDGDSVHVGVTALDAPLVHLAGATELPTAEKAAAGNLGFDGKGNDVSE